MIRLYLPIATNTYAIKPILHVIVSTRTVLSASYDAFFLKKYPPKSSCFITLSASILLHLHNSLTNYRMRITTCDIYVFRLLAF